MKPGDMIFYELRHGAVTNHFIIERNTDHSFPLHMHRCYEMVLMLDGEMKIQIDGEEYVLRENDLILIKPNRLHRYETEEGKGGTCLLCVFSGDLIAAINEPLTKYRLRSTVIHGVSQLYKDVFARMEEADDLPTVKGILYLLCALFYGLVDDTAVEDYSGDTVLLYKMFEFIETHVDSPCTLSDLAEVLKYNESYLSRIFTKYVGIPFSDYVRNVKINHACYLLRNSNESVYAVSVKCGYAAQSTFCRCFKKITGVSPNEYRRRK